MNNVKFSFELKLEKQQVRVFAPATDITDEIVVCDVSHPEWWLIDEQQVHESSGAIRAYRTLEDAMHDLFGAAHHAEAQYWRHEVERLHRV